METPHVVSYKDAKTMKTKIKLIVAVVSSFILYPSSLLAQGTLTPPGAPAPTMKTLSQVEPRTPISTAPFTISAPGSYYVTTNLTAGVNQSGILVAADNVTIDLNGFTLFGGGGTVGEGVSASGARANIVVRNGTVRNWPGSGVNFYDSGASQTLVQNIQSISNTFTGIAVKNGSRVFDCFTLGNGTRGVLVDNDCLVEHCKATGNASGGVTAGSNCELKNNQSTGNGMGINLTGTGSIVADNMVKSNADNYNLSQGNQLDLLLCEVPESIDWPASVKLVGSLNVTVSNAVTITANNVTLDLNGFAISSTANPAAGYGIELGANSAVTNIAIYNGNISGSVTNNGGTYGGAGFGYGIYYGAVVPYNVRVRGISVSGCQNDGINLAYSGTVVEGCVVQTVGGYGIVARSVSDSTAENCGSAGVYAYTANNCDGYSSGNGTGVYAWYTATGCYGSSSGSGAGVSAATANNCYGSSSSGTGVSAITANNCAGSSAGSGYGVNAFGTATGCYGSSSSGTGLSAFIANVCFGQTSTGTALSTTHNVNSF